MVKNECRSVLKMVNKSKSKIKFMLFIILFNILFGCSDGFEIGKLDIVKMPTSYIFNIPKDLLEKKILEEFSKSIPDSELNTIFRIKTRKDVETTDLIKYIRFNHIRSPKDSMILYSPIMILYDSVLNNAVVRDPIGLSYDHYFSGDSVHPIYSAKFKLVLESTGLGTTLVKVITLDPQIAIGYETRFNSHSLWWQKESINIEVKPSTIEECKILLRIGSIFGIEKDMLKLIE